MSIPLTEVSFYSFFISANRAKLRQHLARKAETVVWVAFMIIGFLCNSDNSATIILPSKSGFSRADSDAAFLDVRKRKRRRFKRV